jgi:hypothetical protein
MLCACNPTSVLSSNIITRAESWGRLFLWKRRCFIGRYNPDQHPQIHSLQKPKILTFVSLLFPKFIINRFMHCTMTLLYEVETFLRPNIISAKRIFLLKQFARFLSVKQHSCCYWDS